MVEILYTIGEQEHSIVVQEQYWKEAFMLLYKLGYPVTNIKADE